MVHVQAHSFYDTHPSSWTMIQESFSAEFIRHILLCLQQKDQMQCESPVLFCSLSAPFRLVARHFRSFNKKYDVITFSQDCTQQLS